jgi:hypothetical protein
MLKTYLVMTLLSTLLLGCGRSILDNNEGRCPFTDRGGCQSMERVNQMVSERRFTPDGQFVQQANHPYRVILVPARKQRLSNQSKECPSC